MQPQFHDLAKCKLCSCGFRSFDRFNSDAILDLPSKAPCKALQCRFVEAIYIVGLDPGSLFHMGGLKLQYIAVKLLIEVNR